ncbi:protein F37C4.5-like isoform X3 [Tubulanus polymorphus]|uniref:protein F37C4.5-like isoform X3 n=1 Tax=Tubulanus polymorphus TaxID=672921 RepID=UPI003DA22936
MATLAEEESYTEEQTMDLVDAKSVYDATRCPVEYVIVYLDRAEVCRLIKARLRKGENELIVKKLSPSVDRDSIRVEGKGPATILEVIYHCKPLTDEEDEAEQRHSDLVEKLHGLRKNKEAMEARKSRLLKQREVLDGFADNLLKPPSEDKKEKPDTETKPYQVQVPNTLDGNLLEGMVGFFELYEKQATRLDESLHELGIEMEKLEEKIKKTDEAVRVAENYRDEHMAREVTILMEAAEEGEVELYLSYVVTKAKWSPKYDIRVFSGDSRMKLPICYMITQAAWANYSDFENIKTDARMKIIYYGLIQQATGEDWDDAKLTLSTAMPSVGGTVPDLGTQRLFFKPKYNVSEALKHLATASTSGDSPYATLRRNKTRKPNKKVGRAWSFHATKDEKAFLKQYGLLSDEESSAKEDEKDKSEKDDKDSSTKEKENVKENLTSTTYEVVRRHCIPSDNIAHRVSIAIIDLNPTFEYETVPKRSPYAYLRAKVKNTSPYALLAGPTSIFLDNNFCAKADIKAVAPQEDFTCSLGADHAVQIAYKPLHKYRESSGVVGKNLIITHKQTIDVKNTHNEAIKILIMDQLPLATEEKIKVTLVEPVIKHPEKYDRSKQVRLNKFNNIEWDLEIPANESKELTLKYTVEHPTTEEVDASVLHLPHPHEV